MLTQTFHDHQQTAVTWQPAGKSINPRAWTDDERNCTAAPAIARLSISTYALPRMANRRNELRHLVVERMIERCARTEGGKMPKGFWPSVVAVLTLLEGQDAPGEVELQVWWTRHRRICLETPESWCGRKCLV